jgi:hypothetical protein
MVAWLQLDFVADTVHKQLDSNKSDEKATLTEAP